MNIIRNFTPPVTNYYYHITGKNLGDSVELKPNIPSVFEDAEDYSIPRICVSDSILGCLLATGFTNKVEVYCIRKSDVDRKSLMTNDEIIKKKLVWDAVSTREAWILKPTIFNRIGKVEILDEKVLIELKPLTISRKMKGWENFDPDNDTVYTEVYGYKWLEGSDPSFPKDKVFNVYKYTEKM